MVKLVFLAVVLLASSVPAAAALLDPYVQIRFAKSGNSPGPTDLGTETDPSFITNYRQSSVLPSYRLEAAASFGSLGASSSQSGTLASGQGRGMNAFGILVDSLTITSPNPEATYRWAAKIRLTGVVDWTHTGTLTNLNWPVGIAVAQYTKLPDETDFTRYSLPDILPEKGVFDQEIELPEMVVPANQPFNYALILAANTRLGDSGDRTVTASSADFLNTLRVTGLTLKDSTGAPIDFQIQSGSGALYTENGIQVVPEPGTVTLFALGLVGVVGIRLKTRRA